MRVRFPIFAPALVAASILSAPAPPGSQQATDWDPHRALVTRADLEALLTRFEQAARSPAYSEEMRARARYEASLIRTRLAEGDFQVGDRVWLRVEGEPELSDTFVVATGPSLPLPGIGDIPLRGVLRAELESHLRTELGRFIRDPVVRARPLIRIAIFGEVARPGFYVVPTDMLLTDALMLAGGPAREAKLTEIWVERKGRRIWGGEPLQEGIIEGRTLDQLNLLAGDRVHVPGRKGVDVMEIVRVSALALPTLIFGLSRIF